MLSHEMEVKVAYNGGLLDGILMMAQLVDGCQENSECKKRMVANMLVIARTIASNRVKLLMHVLVEPRSLEELIDSG